MTTELPLPEQLRRVVGYHARDRSRRAWLSDARSVGAETQQFVDEDLRWTELGERAYHALNRGGLGVGPDVDAPLVELWHHAGLDCAVMANTRMGLFNGYVRLPADHPYRDVSCWDLYEHDVHAARELNYGPDLLGWVGFDTAHPGDWWAPDDLIGILDPESLEYFGAGGVAGLMWATMRQFGHDPSHDPFWHQWTMAELHTAVEDLADQLAARA